MNTHLDARKSSSRNHWLRLILTGAALGGFVVVAAPAPAAAQWLHYPTAGLPRTADGKPDLAGPAPKTVDGKPDLSGIWAAEDNRPCPPGGCADMAVGQEFLDIGWGLKGGLPYLPWAAASREGAERAFREGRSPDALPAFRRRENAHRSSAQEDRSGPRTCLDHLRTGHGLSPDFHGCATLAG